MSEILNDLQKLIDAMPAVEFSALTVSPAFNEQLRAHSKPSAEQFPSLGGIDVYVLTKQKVGAIEWKDKNLLNLYLEMMGERETEQHERLDALKTLAEKGQMDFSELVIQTIQIPTETILDWLKPITMEDIPKLDVKPFAMEYPMRITNRLPFYTKFIKR